MRVPQTARAGEIIRYLLTGALGATVNVAGAVFLTECVGLNYLVSLTICSALVIVIGFFLNRSWTFRKRGTSAGTEFLRYALVTGINVPIGLASCALLVNLAGIPYAYSIAIVAVAFAPVTYFVHRLWTFGLGWVRGGQ
jgi:putative flippase GtrA